MVKKIQQNLHQNASLPHTTHGILPSPSPLPTVLLHLLQRRETPQKRFKFQLVLFLWELLPCRIQCHVGWVPLCLPCCTAASIHSSQLLKPRARRNKFPHSPLETQKHVFGKGIVTTGGWKQGLCGGDPLGKWELLHRPQGTSLQTSAASVIGLASHSYL